MMRDEVVASIQHRLRLLEKIVHPALHALEESYEDALELMKSELEKSDDTVSDAVTLCDMVCELMVMMTATFYDDDSLCSYVKDAINEYKRRLGDQFN